MCIVRTDYALRKGYYVCKKLWNYLIFSLSHFKHVLLGFRGNKIIKVL